MIGDAGFQWKSAAKGLREGGFGYFLEPEYWGQGYATEAAKLVLDLAFGVLGAGLMRASCDAQNRASERVMQKCGLKREPRIEAPGRRAYGISREDWRFQKR